MVCDKPRLLLVDDETVNLALLAGLLDEAGYLTECVSSGEQAWSMLQNSKNKFQAVLLDRCMPDIDGVEILKRLKKDPVLKFLPVIMQTAKNQDDDILEGLEAGAHYYITKPFEHSLLLAVVNSAIEVSQWHESLEKRVQDSTNVLGFLKSGTFHFKTLVEGENLISVLAKSCPNSSQLVTGLSELMVNAIEHGNLEITYDEKTQLLKDNTLQEEIIRRQALADNKNKHVTLSFQRKPEKIIFTIQDCGKGFEWETYLTMDPSRAFDTHGRGIAMAKAMSFDELTYEDNGATVVACVNLDERED